jgi:polysaccharide deacetylase family protein (PEP-CTERM system associated)
VSGIGPFAPICERMLNMKEQASKSLGITNILTVDVEDWPQSTLNPHLPISGRALSNTRRLLDLFQEFGVKATFFVQGRVAEKFPKLVERIAGEGHEIGTHGHNHIPLFKQKPEEFAQDLRLSLEILGPMTLQPLLGYRAPDFSLCQDTLWALEILREQGIRYSSSIFPFRGRRYGVPGNLFGSHSTPEGITEVPLSVVTFAGRAWPVAGGGYLRLYPYRLTRWAMRRIQGEGRPVVVYIHPYELDPGEIEPYRRKIPRGLYWSQAVNRKKTESKLRALLSEFKFVPVREAIHI